MKRVDGDIGVRVVDEYGRHAVRCMRRIQEVGYEEFLQQELRKPSRDDPEWHETILEELALRAENRRLGRPVTWRPQEWAAIDRMRTERRRQGVEPPATAHIEPLPLDDL